MAKATCTRTRQFRLLQLHTLMRVEYTKIRRQTRSGNIKVSNRRNQKKNIVNIHQNRSKCLKIRKESSS